MKKCFFYIGLGIGVGILYKSYEKELLCACKKMMNLEKSMIENGLDLN